MFTSKISKSYEPDQRKGLDRYFLCLLFLNSQKSQKLNDLTLKSNPMSTFFSKPLHSIICHNLSELLMDKGWNKQIMKFSQNSVQNISVCFVFPSKLFQTCHSTLSSIRYIESFLFH